MSELMEMLKLIEKVAVLLGPSITSIIIIYYVYNRHFKRGNIIVIKGNNKNKVENDQENKNNIDMLPHCEERLRFCSEKFLKIEKEIEVGGKRYSELERLARDTHTNVAILLERTEILKIAAKGGQL